MTKSINKKVEIIDYTVANNCIAKLKSNHKNVLVAENTFDSLVFVDVITVASTCSFYEHGSKKWITHIKSELMGKKLARNEIVTAKYLKKLFTPCNNPITRDLIGCNQSETKVIETFRKAKIDSRGSLERFIVAQNEINNPKEALKDTSETSETSEVIEITDKEFIAEISKQLKARNFKSLSPLKTLQSDIQELQKSLLDTGFKDTIKKVA